MISQKKSHLTVKMIKFISDIFIIAVSFIIGCKMKFKLFLYFSDVKYYENMYVDVDIYLNFLWLLILIWIVSFLISGLYKERKGPLAQVDEIKAVGIGVSVATLQTLAFTFIFESLPQSRYVIVYAAVSIFVLMFFSRLTINKLYSFWKTKSSQNLRSIIIGATSVGQNVAEKMILYPELGFQYLGTISNRQPKKLNFHLKYKFKRLGSIPTYKKIFKQLKVQAVFITTNINSKNLNNIISYCKENNIIIRFTPSRYHFRKGSLNFTDMDGIPLMQIYHTSFNKLNLIIKRIIDIIITIPLFLISLPILVTISIIIRLNSPGPALYKQLRVGKTKPQDNLARNRKKNIVPTKKSGK